MKKYSEYKDSGMEWLGEIPTHWKFKKSRFYFKFNKGLTITKENLQKTGIPCVSYGEIHSKFGFELNPEKDLLSCVPSYYIDDNTKSILSRGDFVFADTSEDIEGSGNFTHLHSEIQTFAGYHTIIARLKTKDNYRFIAYLLDSLNYRHQIRSRVKGVKVFSITNKILKDTFLWSPQIEEQIQIAKYLDYQIGLIDQIIEKKELLIKKLKEQRQAIINEAVTKGLNPNAKMKYSGIEWLGEIPEHWEVVRFRHFFSFSKGLSITKENLIDEGIPCVNYGEIHSKYGFEVNPTKNILKCVSKDYCETDKKALLSNGDFVFADTSEDIEGSGNFTYLNSDIPTFAGYHTIVARLKNTKQYRFFAYFFDSLVFRTQIRILVKGVKVFSITNKILKGALLFYPPEEEQKAITKYIDNNTDRISDSLQKLEQSIEKLKSYRQSIISEVVTGKIDVRDWKN